MKTPGFSAVRTVANSAPAVPRSKPHARWSPSLRGRAGRHGRALALALAAGILMLLHASAPLAAASGNTETWKGIESLPDQPAVAVIVDKKSRIYFRATPQQPLVVPIGGPARLRVVSRAELTPGTKEPLAYRIRVSTGQKRLKEQRTQTVLSSDATLRSRAPSLGQSRQMIVKVPQGGHSLRISVEGASGVLIRLLRAEPKNKRERMVTLTPVDAPRSVSLKEEEKLIPYYSALPGKPVRFRVVGSTTLDVITRLDFDPTMRGTQIYRLAISDGGRPPREVEYRTTKALTAIYPDLRDRVPAKFRLLRLPIGKGVHEISVALVSPRNGSVEVRARIPQPAVGKIE